MTVAGQLVDRAAGVAAAGGTRRSSTRNCGSRSSARCASWSSSSRARSSSVRCGMLSASASGSSRSRIRYITSTSCRSSRGTRAPLLRLVLGQPLCLQDAQRLAHRQPARAEALGDLLLPDPLARADVAGQDRLAQVVRDPRAGRPRPVVDRVGAVTRRPRPRPGRTPCRRVGHQLELHAPRAQEVDPALALVRPLLAVGSPSTVHAAARGGGRPRRRGRRRRARRGGRRRRCCAAAAGAVGRGVVEHLEDRLAAEPEEAVLRMTARGCTLRCSAIQSPSSWRRGRASRGTRSPARRPGTAGPRPGRGR